MFSRALRYTLMAPAKTAVHCRMSMIQEISLAPMALGGIRSGSRGNSAIVIVRRSSYDALVRRENMVAPDHTEDAAGRGVEDGERAHAPHAHAPPRIEQCVV